MKFLNYPDCIELSNGETVVVIGQHVGGRVLSYKWKGVEALYMDPAEGEWEEGKEGGKVASAGRFDIGPEYLVPERDTLWTGEYEVIVRGPRKVALASAADEATGVRIIREFVLAEEGTHLECLQEVENVSRDRTTRWCHWGRTFARHGGIAVVPLTIEESKFENGWVRVEGERMLNMNPEDPNVRRRGNFLEITGPPAYPKMGFDTYAEWMGYVLPEGVAFVKGWAASPDWIYNEVAGYTLSVWYPEVGETPACELEPIGPMEVLRPGEVSAMREHWYLLEHAFPKAGEQLDLEGLEAKARELAGQGSAEGN